MSPERDTRLGEHLEVFDPPDHGPAFWTAVEAGVAGARREAAREATRPPRRRLWLRPALAGVAAAAACAVLALALAGLPGTTEVGPQPAGAVGRLLAAVDAGLAKVRTLQGVIVTTDARGRAQLARFAATAAGDEYVDQPVTEPPAVVRVRRRTYRRDLADMRAGRQPWDRRQLRADRAVVVRRQWAGDAGARVSTDRAWCVDAFTGRPVGIGYSREVNSDGRSLGMPEPVGPDPANVWGLSSAVRVAIADAPDEVTLSDTAYEGRPATRALIGVAGRRWVATIDKQFGLVLAFAPADGTTGGTRANPYVAFRLADLRVNAPIARKRFTVPAVFSLDASFKPISLGRHDQAAYTYDEDYVTAAVPRVVRSAGMPVLVPARVPRGYRLWPLATDYGTTVTLSYVQGIGTVQVEESDREQYPTADRATWVDMESGALPSTPGLVTETRGGALDGWPMRIRVPQLGDPKSADWWNAGVDGGADTPAVSLRGVLTRSQFLGMISSMRPYGGWSLVERPAYQYGRLLLAIVMGLVIAAVAIEIVGAVRARRERRARRGLRTAELLALSGCVAIAVSLWLPWYRLESASRHVDYALRGGSIRFAVAALACASGAAIVALLRAAMGGWRLPAREPVLLAVFALFALALLVDVRLVQPDQARFTLGDAAGGAGAWPTPWVGMLAGFAGVALILLAAVFARERRPPAGADH